MRSHESRRILLPAAATVLALLAWEFALPLLDVPQYLIPPPSAVLVALKLGLVGGTLWSHLGATLAAFVLGYLLGCAGGLLLAAAMSEFPDLEVATYPLVIAFQAVPKMAMAPVLIVWFGFGMESKVVMVALVCFFPCFVNALAGLKSYSPNLVDLYRSFGASKAQIFWSVKVPSSLGAVFAGLEISVVLALLGVVVSELIASRSGLGHVIAAAGVDFNVAMMFACLVLLAILGVVASQLVTAVRRRVAFWDLASGGASASRAS